MDASVCPSLFYFIGVELTCSVALVLGIQQSVSVVDIYPFFPHLGYDRVLS